MTTPREALEALHRSTSGWRAGHNWLGGGSFCRWHGVGCEAGEVTSIDLGGGGLGGSLPPQLASLTSLRTLNIDESRLSGTLPAELGKLPQLETLLLGGNPALSGTLPASLQSAGGLLSVLDFSGSRLSGTLSGALIRASPRLDRLQLDHTRLSGTLPGERSPLLRYLFVHSCPALSGALAETATEKQADRIVSSRIIGTVPARLAELFPRQPAGILSSVRGRRPLPSGAGRSLR